MADSRSGGSRPPRKPGSGSSRGKAGARPGGSKRPAAGPKGGGSSDRGKPAGSSSTQGAGRPSGKPAGARSGQGAGRSGKPDRAAGSRGARVVERDTSRDLPWPEEIFGLELDPEVFAELEAAGGPTSTMAKHILSVQVLAETDPEAAYQHASRVRDRLPRSAVARQTACIAAYRAGHYREAIKEESAYRRISGSVDLVPIAADCERGLKRPERALALLAEFEKAADAATRTELLVVASGARQDLGDLDAARMLAQKAVRTAKGPMEMARSRYALGKLVADSGDIEQARKWLQSAVDLDEEGIWTDAADVLAAL